MLNLLFKIFPNFFLNQLLERIEKLNIRAYAYKANNQLRHNCFSRFDLDRRYYIIIKANMEHNLLLISAYMNFTHIKTKEGNWISDEHLQDFISHQLFDFKLELKKELYLY